MKKLFISQPMKGLSNEQIENVRESAIEAGTARIKEVYGEDEPVEVLESFFKDAPHDAAPLWFLGESLKMLSTADVAYFCEGWEDARGCRIENDCAIAYDLPLVVEDYSGMTRVCRNTRDRIIETKMTAKS